MVSHEDALDAYLAAVTAAEPSPIVRDAVRRGLLDELLDDKEAPATMHVLALGKAAPAMVWGLVETQVPVTGLGVAPLGTKAPTMDGFHWLAGEHPVPGPGSADAAQAVLAWADSLPENAPVVVCLSGGASACCEGEPAPEWAAWLREGIDIVEMNRRRAAASDVKGGRLAARILARTQRVVCLVLSDVPPEHPEAVASGPVWHPKIPHHVLADSRNLVQSAGLRLGAAGYDVYAHERIAGPIDDEAPAFAKALAGLPRSGRPVALVAAGEPLVHVPSDAPRGGRASHAALAVGRHLDDALVLCGASDGVDADAGSGAWSGPDASPEAADALRRRAAFSYLDSKGQTFNIGASGTNLGDLWVALSD